MPTGVPALGFDDVVREALLCEGGGPGGGATPRVVGRQLPLPPAPQTDPPGAPPPAPPRPPPPFAPP